ncbi:MAG: hypothetical protein LC739_09615 [Actinobacteria bacterium]|nr:hypothetical protein [Actinomycetota bacterium]
MAQRSLRSFLADHPTRFMEMISTVSPEQVGRVMAAMMKMQKMDVGTFEEAYRG